MYKFLLIEDAKEDRDSCLDTVKRMNAEAETEVYHVDIADTYEDGLEKLKRDYYGVIVDIKLDNGYSGNQIIKTIIEKYRVPVAVMTGTPDTELDENSPIHVYKKGEESYETIIKALCKSLETGLFNVLGGTGIIETLMNQIFWKNLYPQIGLWEQKKEQCIDTEKVLLRYAVSHIQELIDGEIPAYVTEEMYIKPPITEEIKTGSIIKSSKDNQFFVVLSPPCDLALHDGHMKTNRVLLCEIDDPNTVNAEVFGQCHASEKRKKLLEKALNNKYTDYYHWLPSNTLFDGGYINFRKVLTYSPSSLNSKFSQSLIKIQESFVKSILGRFSAYYARQGQPDFDFSQEAATIVKKSTSEQKQDASVS